MKRPKAICTYCQESITHNARSIKAHLKKCEGVQANQKKMDTSEYLLVKVISVYSGEWLLLKVHPNIQMEDIDTLLISSWIGCCGHMSAFMVDRDYINMKAAAGDVFEKLGNKIQYEYDFGTTTYLELSILGTTILPNDGNLLLLFQNEELTYPCGKCGKKATHICYDCMYDGKEDCIYCDACENTHGHTEENRDYDGKALLYNSPRVGVCGYEGPVDFKDYLSKNKKQKPTTRKRNMPKNLLEDFDSFFGY